MSSIEKQSHQFPEGGNFNLKIGGTIAAYCNGISVKFIDVLNNKAHAYPDVNEHRLFEQAI